MKNITLFLVMLLSPAAAIHAYPTYPVQAADTSDERASTYINDIKIDQRIEKALRGEYPDVSYQTVAGSVTLRGTVRTQSGKQTVESRIRGLPDVRDIYNYLEVRPDAP